jgi:hypothetical protein
MQINTNSIIMPYFDLRLTVKSTIVANPYCG